MQADSKQKTPLTATFHTTAHSFYAAYLDQGDIPDLMHLQAKARAPDKAALIPRTATQIAEGMAKGYSHIGIYNDGELIAHARIAPDNDDSSDPSCEAALCAVMVDPGWRGYKLAHTLIASAIREAQHLGYTGINTRVLPRNTPMWATFEKHGFECEKLAKSHERPAVPDCNVYHYKRWLNSAAPHAT